ncbi:MAG: hypothetical protein JNK82_15480 [Myxococcaceae bacterium]|nr:hypothetical protein [Myxococcaceae bacterium]
MLLLCVACAPREPAACTHLKGLLSRCVGTTAARLDCSTVTDSDVQRLTDVVEGTSCEVLVSALPADGNLQSATCRMFNVGCVAPASPAPRHQPTRYPVVLVNGIDTSPLFRYSDRIVDMLREGGGHDVHLATLTPYEPPRRRAPELWRRVRAILEATHADKVNLVCHSLGGLDCRWLVSPGGFALDAPAGEDPASKVASITTFGTAHRGTRAVDLMLGLVPGGDAEEAIDDFAAVAGDWFTPEALERDPAVRDALNALTTVAAEAFNAETPDAPHVYYQSYAGLSHPLGETTAAAEQRAAELCRADDVSDATRSTGGRDDMALTLVPFDAVVSTKDGARLPHDGLVSVDSARWGVFRGCVPADHMEQLGQRNLPDVNVTTGVDIARFYTELAADLALKGL